MRTKRLSEKKIFIELDTDIYYNDIIIDTIKTRFVYKKKTKSTYNSSNIDETKDVYSANIKPGFIARICNKYRIRKLYVYTPHKDKPGKEFEIDVDGEKVNVILNDIMFVDPDWYIRWNREEQLKKLLGL